MLLYRIFRSNHPVTQISKIATPSELFICSLETIKKTSINEHDPKESLDNLFLTDIPNAIFEDEFTHDFIKQLCRNFPQTVKIILTKACDICEEAQRAMQDDEVQGSACDRLKAALKIIAKILPILFSSEFDDLKLIILLDGSVESLALSIAQVVMKSACLPGYTMSPSQKRDPWCVCVQTHNETIEGHFETMSEILKSRIEVLSLLLSLLSENLGHSNQKPSIFCEIICGDDSIPCRSELFYYLLNTLLRFQTPSKNFFRSSLAKNGLRRDLASVSFEILTLLLQQDRKNTKFSYEGNYFIEYFKTLRAPAQLELVLDCLIRLLDHVNDQLHQNAQSTELPIISIDVGVAFIWNVLTKNANIGPFLTSANSFTDFFISFATLMSSVIEITKSQTLAEDEIEFVPAQRLIMVAFLLLHFSSTRSLVVRWNSRVEMQRLRLIGRHRSSVQSINDALIILCCRALGLAIRLNSRTLGDLVLTSICNMTPYCRDLSYEASTDLLMSLKFLSNPEWLFGGYEIYHRLNQLILLINSFNNILQYQYEPNLPFACVLLRSSDSIYNSNRFNFANFSQLRCRHDQKDETMLKEQLNIVSSKIASALLPCTKFLDHLLPLVNEHCEKVEVTDDDQIIALLKENTVVGILPVPHSIAIRCFQSDPFSAAVWMNTVLWIEILRRKKRKGLASVSWYWFDREIE